MWVTACPRCSSLLVGAGPCAYCGYVPGAPSSPPVTGPYAPFPAAAPPAPMVVEAGPSRWRPTRWVRRTRRGLLITALGLMLSWIPFVSAVGALFLSLGSTFLFLGARGAGRRHEIAVVLAFLVLAIGGVAIGFLLGAFLLQAYDAAFAGRPFSTLREAASLLVWATLPATVAVASGFGLQVVALLPPRRQRVLLGLCVLLVASAVAATWLSDPEVAALAPVRVTYGSVSEFLLRLSLYRMVEAPAYVGLGLLYLATYLDTSPAGGSPRLPAARPEEG